MSFSVTVADHAGACYGVNRALDLVMKASKNREHVHTLGPLIHNPRVVSELESAGIETVESLSDIEAGDTVVIRSHGVAPSVIEEARHRGLCIVDATCPHVSKAQKSAERLHDDGRLVIVVGEAEHPEVEAICAYAHGDVIRVSDVTELPADLPSRLGVVVQTTQSSSVFSAVVDELSRRTDDLVVCDTICFATQQRQRSAEELSRKVDCMLVVGGRNSGNTRRLFSICSTHCPRTHHIEAAEEIDPSWFIGCERIGITAGASTPQSQIDSVVHAVESL